MSSQLLLRHDLNDFLANGHVDRSIPRVLAKNLQRALASDEVDVSVRLVIDACAAEILRWLEAGEHRGATAELLTIAHNGERMRKLGTRRLMMISKALQSVGLFEASEPFYRASLERAASGWSPHPSRRAELAIARVRLAIFLEDPERFATMVRRLTRFGSSQLKGVAELRALDRFSRDNEGAAVPSGWFGDLVQEVPVLLCGPGPLGDGLPVPNQMLVARILTNPLPNFDDRTDPAEGRTDLGYRAASIGKQLLRPESPFRAAVIGRFRALSFPSEEVVSALAGAGEGRVRRYSKPRLFGHGTSFMAINILWDLLSNAAQEVLITGITAFLGREPYRASQNRPTAFGSVPGEEFNRCFEYAKNDVIFNRSVLKKLGASSRVIGDTAFIRMVGLSHGEYLRELDEIYGINRR